MTRFLNALNRFLAPATAVLVVVALWRLVSEIHPSTVRDEWMGLSRDQSIVYGIALIALALWIVVLSGWIHSRRPPHTGQKSKLMDILDRLTNRQALEARLQLEATSEIIDAAALADALKSKVIGQDQVCDDIAAQIRRRLALQQRGKPIGVFLFCGHPGTGKTYLAKQLAIQCRRKLLHFDMTQLSRGTGGSMLFGTPKGYVGSDSYGKLTAGLRDTPNAIVLLDEFEKAHPDVHTNFLTAWNDGFITEASDGKQISTTRAIFIITTNAGMQALDELQSRFENDGEELRKVSTNILLENGLAPEVLSRIDRIFIFRRLFGLDVARVTALEIEAMISNYGLSVCEGGIDPEVLWKFMETQEKLAGHASSRDLVRSIEESIADSLIVQKQAGQTSIRLLYRDQKISAVAGS
ncbi:AAA family ATPase [Variovorax sp. Root411]|uniref:AAA family ATPase n=1 Tax=Variovorax sp. Root411 TaxID=1736530 RepID=UPI0007007E5A|nr:AAA family ATPase [Variovorax sp. Root411]KQW61490.1 hypothetical protein ASC92_26530 [Variovorax sp. Root411]